MSEVLTPALKWAGSKRWLVERMRDLYRPHRHRWFHDLFTGSGAVVLGVRPDRAVMNDGNPHLMNFHRWVRMGLCVDHDIARGKNGLVVPLLNDETTYYAHRDRFNALNEDGESNSQEAAILFWYLNRTGYNGLCRFNRAGQFNVPFGRYARLDYVRLSESFQRISRSMHTWRLTCRHFSLAPTKPGDFIYADPPYDHDGGGFTSYAAGAWQWADQQRLVEFLAKHDGPVVASNAATDRIVDAYLSAGFSVEYVEVRRSISCKADGRKPALEILAMKGV